MPFMRQCRKIWYRDTGHRLQYNRLMDIAFWITMLPTHESEILTSFHGKNGYANAPVLFLIAGTERSTWISLASFISSKYKALT